MIDQHHFCVYVTLILERPPVLAQPIRPMARILYILHERTRASAPLSTAHRPVLPSSPLHYACSRVIESQLEHFPDFCTNPHQTNER